MRARRGGATLSLGQDLRRAILSMTSSTASTSPSVDLISGKPMWWPSGARAVESPSTAVCLAPAAFVAMAEETGVISEDRCACAWGRFYN